jgi:hypothetical protein
MNEVLRQTLLEMAAEDARVRKELADSGELFHGYHPRMEKVHLENAAELEKLLDECGWTGISLVGKDGAEAAWLIVQHAIGRPHFQRKCLDLINEAVEKGEAEPYQAAYLYDRICFFEDRPQRFGTQSDWNEKGEMEVWKLENEEKVNFYRREVGLEPLKEKVIKDIAEPKPTDLEKRRSDFLEWAKRVGWRK